jgi:hypothetical protein
VTRAVSLAPVGQPHRVLAVEILEVEDDERDDTDRRPSVSVGSALERWQALGAERDELAVEDALVRHPLDSGRSPVICQQPRVLTSKPSPVLGIVDPVELRLKRSHWLCRQNA